MAPLISNVKTLEFSLKHGDVKLRYQEFTAKTNSDFIATQTPAREGISPSSKRDMAYFASGTGGGIAADPFYLGAAGIRDFELGNDLHVLNSQGQKVVVVHTI
jgi:hypothetical protein